MKLYNRATSGTNLVISICFCLRGSMPYMPSCLTISSHGGTYELDLLKGIIVPKIIFYRPQHIRAYALQSLHDDSMPFLWHQSHNVNRLFTLNESNEILYNG